MSDDLTDDQKAIVEVMEKMIESGWAVRSVRRDTTTAFSLNASAVPSIRMVRDFMRAFGPDGMTDRHRMAFFWLMAVEELDAADGDSARE